MLKPCQFFSISSCVLLEIIKPFSATTCPGFYEILQGANNTKILLRVPIKTGMRGCESLLLFCLTAGNSTILFCWMCRTVCFCCSATVSWTKFSPSVESSELTGGLSEACTEMLEWPRLSYWTRSSFGGSRAGLFTMKYHLLHYSTLATIKRPTNDWGYGVTIAGNACFVAAVLALFASTLSCVRPALDIINSSFPGLHAFVTCFFLLSSLQPFRLPSLSLLQQMTRECHESLSDSRT